MKWELDAQKGVTIRAARRPTSDKMIVVEASHGTMIVKLTPVDSEKEARTVFATMTAEFGGKKRGVKWPWE